MAKMNKEFVKEKVKIATELIEGIDTQFKDATFLAVLIKLLEGEMKGSDVYKQTKVEEHEILQDSASKLGVQKKKENLASKCNISLDELDKTLDIRSEQVQLLKTIKKGKESEKQRIASKCILVAFFDVCGKDWIDSDMLANSLEKSGISLSTLPRNLRQESESFSIRGSGSGSTLEYTITGPAKVATYEIINKLAKGANLE